MPLSRFLLAACVLPLMLHAQSADSAKPFSYADTVALVKERALSPEQRSGLPNNRPRSIQFTDPAKSEKTEPAPSERIYVAGPTQTNEIYFANGKEVQKSVPYCYILETAAVRNPATYGRLFWMVTMSMRSGFNSSSIAPTRTSQPSSW